MLHHRLVFILLLFISQIISAQETGSITGKFVDKKTHESIPYVSTAILKPTGSTQVKGIASSMDGVFTIDKLPMGKYFLVASTIGYEKYISDTLNITSGKRIIDLGMIELEASAIDLNEVEIVATKPFIEREAGRIIMNVDSDPTTTGDNVLELLRKMPGVTIENDETIKLNGKSGILILIDNRQTYLSGDALITLLKSMQSSLVDKIEAITEPSAKYDAEGISGILNIKTKKNPNIGVNGSVYVSGGYSNTFKHSEGLDLSARFGKITLYGSVGNNSYPNKSDSRSQTIYPNGISFETNMQDNERWLSESKWNGQNYKLGGDLYINNKNIIGFVWRMSTNSSSSEYPSYTRIKKDNITDSAYGSQNNSDGDYTNNIFNLNYKHIFDSSGTEMNIDIDYSVNKRPQTADITTKYWLGNFSGLTRSENTINNTDYFTDIFSAKIDFEHPFSKKIRLEAGIKTSFVKNDNDLRSEYNGSVDIERTNHFIFKENIYAAYATLITVFSEKTSLKAGLRTEYTQNEGYLENLNKTSTQKYLGIFPNVIFHQQLTKNQNIDFAYRYRISRPGYQSLNPFLYRNNLYSYSQGNSDLKPAYAHNVSLSHSFKNAAFSGIEYSYTKDNYTYMDYYNNSTLANLGIPQNIGKEQYLGFSLNAGGTITKWWTCWIYWGGGWTFSEFDYGDSLVNTQKFYTNIWFGQYFYITKNLTAEISGWGSPKTGDDVFSTRTAHFSVNVGVKQMLFNKKLTIRVSVNDIFGTMYWKGNEKYPSGIVFNGENHWESRSVWLSLSYRFGKQDIKIRQRKTASEDEQGRSGNGDSGNEGSR